ncbi:MAG: hypothetical protein FJW79_05335 [Actinobacteria bacterium]|nr:hypothetical protein [Actinomycetota bacterium]
MEILLFILLVGVWAAFVLPSFLSRRRKPAVNRSWAGSPGSIAPDLHRRQVLGRRRLALVVLMLAAVGTLVGAVLTGSVFLLAVTLICDVLLGAYIALLLQIKRRQAESRFAGAGPSERAGAVTY